MDESSSNKTLTLPRGDGEVRVTVSGRLLERAPWLSEGLEATLTVVGKWWPEEVFIGDGLDWVCHNHDNLMFFLPEWAVEVHTSGRKKRQPRLTTLLLRFAPDLDFYAVESSRVCHLAHALYHNLSRYDLAFNEFFLQDDFAWTVRHEWDKRVHGKTPKWRSVCFALLIIPVAIYTFCWLGFHFIAFKIFSRCFPKFRSVRFREARIYRRFKKVWRDFSKSLRIEKDKRSIEKLNKELNPP